MRALDHKYSNYITWKGVLFLCEFPQCNPSASLMLSFVMHGLCYRFFLPAIPVLYIFLIICIWCTCFVRSPSAVIIYPPAPPHSRPLDWSGYFQSHSSKLRIICFTEASCLFYCLLFASLPTDTSPVPPHSLFSSALLMDGNTSLTCCDHVWQDKATTTKKTSCFSEIGFNKRKSQATGQFLEG